MTDRELLELAAKAAGVEIYESTDGTIQNRPVWVFKAGGGMGTMPYEEQWNPLLEDGQALRLAMTLGIKRHQCERSEPVDWHRVSAPETCHFRAVRSIAGR